MSLLWCPVAHEMQTFRWNSTYARMQRSLKYSSLVVPLKHWNATYLHKMFIFVKHFTATVQLDDLWKEQQRLTRTFIKAAPPPSPACENNEHGREEVSNPRGNEEILFQRVINYLWANPQMNTSEAEHFLMHYTAQHNEMWAKLDWSDYSRHQIVSSVWTLVNHHYVFQSTVVF